MSPTQAGGQALAQDSWAKGIPPPYLLLPALRTSSQLRALPTHSAAEISCETNIGNETGQSYSPILSPEDHSRSFKAAPETTSPIRTPSLRTVFSEVPKLVGAANETEEDLRQVWTAKIATDRASSPRTLGSCSHGYLNAKPCIISSLLNIRWFHLCRSRNNSMLTSTSLRQFDQQQQSWLLIF